MFKKYDKGFIGLISGLLMPLIGLLIFYFSMYSHLEFGVFLHRLMVTKLFFSILSICVLPNLIVFFAFIWTHRYFAARGVLAATFFYAFVVMAFRMFD